MLMKTAKIYVSIMSVDRNCNERDIQEVAIDYLLDDSPYILDFHAQHN